MKTISNATVATLLRCLPTVLDNVDGRAMGSDLRLTNAVRRLKIIVNKLKKLEDDGK